MFLLRKICPTSGLLDLIASRTNGCYAERACYSTATASTIESVESEMDNLRQYLSPAGSALFRENKYFSPVVTPDPLLKWDWLERSLIARGYAAQVKLEDLRQMAEEISGMKEKIASLEGSRKVVTHQFGLDENEEERRSKARYLRGKRNELKTNLHQLNLHFQKQVLSLPNFIHDSYVPGSRNSLERSLAHGPVKNLIRWSSVEDNLYVTPAGNFLSGQLAILEQDLCIRTHRFWLNLAKSQTPTYPVALSDFARGPAVEGAGWSDIKNVLRLEPTKSDLHPVTMNPDAVDHSNPGEMRWLVNPHTSNYLVGSASLASFAAYLLRNQIADPNSLPIRLLSLGSVYMSTEAADEGRLRSTLTNSCPNRAATHSAMLPFVQQRQLSLLELTPTWTDCESGFERLTDNLCQFWMQFQPAWTMRLVHVCPDQLRPCEMARSLIELVPKHDSSSIALASVSLLGDWVSRRIGCKCPKLKSAHKNKSYSPYAYMVYAQLMDTRSLFASFEHTGVLEQMSLPSS